MVNFTQMEEYSGSSVGHRLTFAKNSWELIKNNPILGVGTGDFPDEYKKIQNLIKRDPNLLELGIFSAMWNEHCSYKSSKLHLKKLPTKGTKEIQRPGDNARIIDIEDGSKFNRKTVIIKIPRETLKANFIILCLAFLRLASSY